MKILRILKSIFSRPERPYVVYDITHPDWGRSGFPETFMVWVATRNPKTVLEDTNRIRRKLGRLEFPAGSSVTSMPHLLENTNYTKAEVGKLENGIDYVI